MFVDIVFIFSLNFYIIKFMFIDIIIGNLDLPLQN